VSALTHLGGHVGGKVAWGLIVGSIPVGGLLGGVVAYRIKPVHPVATAFAVWSLGGVLPFTLVRPFPLPVIMVAAAMLGACILIGNALWETAMQQEVRRDRLARVASIDQLLSIGLMPAGQALAGAIAAGVGTPATLVLAGTLMCVPNLVVVAFVRAQNCRRRAASPGSPWASRKSARTAPLPVAMSRRAGNAVTRNQVKRRATPCGSSFPQSSTAQGSLISARSVRRLAAWR